MRKALIFAALLLAAPAHARLICGNDDQATIAGWSIGQSADAIATIDTQGDVWCTATSQEKGYIQTHFVGLRSRTGVNSAGQSQFFWVGDDAAFIIENL
jgi:hypothetical protein